MINAAIVGIGRWGQYLVNSVQGQSEHIKFTAGVTRTKSKAENFCKKNDANLIILDDGLQSKSIKKDISILVIDGNYGFGNNRLFPAGPLRETIKKTLKKHKNMDSY